LLTTLSGDVVGLDPVTTVVFERTWSGRLQVGGRLSGQLVPGLMYVAGLASERELDGRSRASIDGYEVPIVDAGGSTGIGELGLSWRSRGPLPVTLGLGVQGFVGVRRWVAGSLQLSLEF
jgi:hypothetical protein